MLKENTQQNDLLNVLTPNNLEKIKAAAKFTEKKANFARPSLNYVHIEAKNGLLTVSATDTHQGLIYTEEINQNIVFNEVASPKNITAFKNKKGYMLKTINSNELQGGFAEFKHIFAIPHDNKIYFKAAELLPALKGFRQCINFIAKENSFTKNKKVITLHFDKLDNQHTTLNIKNHFDQTISISFICDADNMPNQFGINCNIDFLINAINSFDKDSIISMNFECERKLDFFTLTSDTDKTKCIIAPIQVWDAKNN